MKQGSEITAAQILTAKHPGIHLEMPAEADGAQTTSATQVIGAFRERFGNACDSGICKRLSNTVLEPANPFDVKSRRRVRQEAIIIGTLVCAALAFGAYFNLSAPVR
jgi:hypothetical protein